jgi:hypothetical protein
MPQKRYRPEEIIARLVIGVDDPYATIAAVEAALGGRPPEDASVASQPHCAANTRPAISAAAKRSRVRSAALPWAADQPAGGD